MPGELILHAAARACRLYDDFFVAFLRLIVMLLCLRNWCPEQDTMNDRGRSNGQGFGGFHDGVSGSLLLDRAGSG
jgi:hypothetical protein